MGDRRHRRAKSSMDSLDLGLDDEDFSLPGLDDDDDDKKSKQPPPMLPPDIPVPAVIATSTPTISVPVDAPSPKAAVAVATTPTVTTAPSSTASTPKSVTFAATDSPSIPKSSGSGALTFGSAAASTGSSNGALTFGAKPNGRTPSSGGGNTGGALVFGRPPVVPVSSSSLPPSTDTSPALSISTSSNLPPPLPSTPTPSTVPAVSSYGLPPPLPESPIPPPPNRNAARFGAATTAASAISSLTIAPSIAVDQSAAKKDGSISPNFSPTISPIGTPTGSPQPQKPTRLPPVVPPSSSIATIPALTVVPPPIATAAPVMPSVAPPVPTTPIPPPVVAPAPVSTPSVPTPAVAAVAPSDDVDDIDTNFDLDDALEGIDDMPAGAPPTTEPTADNNNDVNDDNGAPVDDGGNDNQGDDTQPESSSQPVMVEEDVVATAPTPAPATPVPPPVVTTPAPATTAPPSKPAGAPPSLARATSIPTAKVAGTRTSTTTTTASRPAAGRPSLGGTAAAKRAGSATTATASSAGKRGGTTTPSSSSRIPAPGSSSARRPASATPTTAATSTTPSKKPSLMKKPSLQSPATTNLAATTKPRSTPTPAAAPVALSGTMSEKKRASPSSQSTTIAATVAPAAAAAGTRTGSVKKLPASPASPPGMFSEKKRPSNMSANNIGSPSQDNASAAAARLRLGNGTMWHEARDEKTKSSLAADEAAEDERLGLLRSVTEERGGTHDDIEEEEEKATATGGHRTAARAPVETNDALRVMKQLAFHFAPAIAALPTDGTSHASSTTAAGGQQYVIPSVPIVTDVTIQSIVVALRASKGSAGMTQECCRVLYYLSLVEENSNRIVREGALKLLIKAMFTHPNAEIIKNVCATLGHMCVFNTWLQESVVRSGGIEAILNMMRQHRLVVDIQRQACHALACIYSGARPSTFSPPPLSLLTTANGSASSSATASSGSSTDSLHGYFATPTFVPSNGHNVAQPNTATNGALSCGDVPNVDGYYTLMLSRLPPFRRGAPTTGATTTATDVLPATLHDTSVASSTAAAGSPSVVSGLIGISRQCVDALATAMSTHTTNQQVQEEACMALWSIAKIRSSHLHIVSKGGIGAVCSLMLGYAESPVIQHASLGVLVSVCVQENNKTHSARNQKLTVDEGGIEAVVAAMRRWTHHRAIQLLSCDLLTVLVAHAPAALKSKGGIETSLAAVRLALDTHITDGRVVDPNDDTNNDDDDYDDNSAAGRSRRESAGNKNRKGREEQMQMLHEDMKTRRERHIGSTSFMSAKKWRGGHHHRAGTPLSLEEDWIMRAQVGDILRKATAMLWSLSSTQPPLSSDNGADGIGYNSFQLCQSLVGAVVSVMTLYPTSLELQAESCRLLQRLCDHDSNWNVGWKGSWTGDSAGWAEPIASSRRDRAGSLSASDITLPTSPSPPSSTSSLATPQSPVPGSSASTLSSPLKRERRSRRDRDGSGGNAERGHRRTAEELADEARRTCVDRGGVDAIVEAMRLHSEHAGYFIIACNILCCIATKYHKESIVAKGVIECIRSALIVHPESSDVQISASRLLARLVKNSNVRRGLADPNTGSVSYWMTPAGESLIGLFCRALTHWQTDADVVSHTMTFIIGLCAHAANIPLVVDRAIGPVLDLIPLHPTSRSTLGLALMCCHLFTVSHARSLRLYRQDEQEEDEAVKEEAEEEKDETDAQNKPAVVPLLPSVSDDKKATTSGRGSARVLNRARSRSRSKDELEESSSTDTLTLQPIYEEAVNDEQDTIEDERDEHDIPHSVCDCKIVVSLTLEVMKQHSDDSVIQRCGCHTLLNILSHPVHARNAATDSPALSATNANGNGAGVNDDDGSGNGSDAGSSLLTSIRHHLVRKGGLSLLLHQLVGAASSTLPIDSSTVVRARGRSRSNSLSSQASALSATTATTSTSTAIRPMPGLVRVAAGLLRCLLASAHPRVSVLGKMGHRVSQLVMDLTRKMWRRRSLYQLAQEEKLRNERNKRDEEEKIPLSIPPTPLGNSDGDHGGRKSTRDSVISPASPLPPLSPSPPPPDLGVHARLRFSPRYTVAYSLPILCDLAEVSSLLCRQSSSHRERLGRGRSDEERKTLLMAAAAAANDEDDEEAVKKRLANEVESGLESLLETVRLLLFVASTPPAAPVATKKNQRHTSTASIGSPTSIGRALSFNGMSPRTRSSSRDSRTTGAAGVLSPSASPTNGETGTGAKKWRRSRDKYEWHRNGDWEQNCVRASLRGLSMAAFNSRVNQRAIIERGGIELTTLCMRGWQAVANVQSDACELLWKLCMCGDLRDRVPDAISMMSSGSDEIKKWNVVAEIEADRRRLAIADATRTAMKAYGTIPVLQARACGVIWALAADENNRMVARLNLGATDILAAMAAHPISSLVQEQGCLALSALCEDNNEQQQAILKAGGIAIVVDGMVAHIATPSMLLHACILLSTLLASSVMKPVAGYAAPGQPGSVVATIVDHDGIAAVLSAMRESASSPSPVATLLHLHAIDILFHLSCTSAYRQRIVTEGALSSILRIIRAPHPPHVHIKACSILALLATEPANRTTIVRKGSVEILLAVMARHDMTVATEAAYALACLMMSDFDDDKDSESSEQKGDEQKQRSNSNAGENDSDSDDERAKATADEPKRIAPKRVVLNKGGLDLLISTIVSHPNDAALVARFLSALAAFTAPPLSLAAPHILAHPNGAPTTSSTSGTNVPLPALYQEIINRFITHKRGLDCVVTALKTHTNDARVVEAAASLLANITHPCALLYYRHSVHQSPQSNATAAAAAVVAATTNSSSSSSSSSVTTPASAAANSGAPPATSFLWNSLFARNGGAEVLLRATQHHTGIASVQEQTMRALCHLLCQLGNWAAFYAHATAMQLAAAQASSIASATSHSRVMSLVPPTIPSSPNIAIPSPNPATATAAPSFAAATTASATAAANTAAATAQLNQQRELELRGWSALLRGGIIEAILGAMRTNHQTIGVASRGCRALAILSRWLPSHITLPPAGGATAVATATTTPSSSSSATPPSLPTSAPPALPSHGPPKFNFHPAPTPTTTATPLSLDAFLSSSSSSTSSDVTPSTASSSSSSSSNVPSTGAASSAISTGGMSPLLALINQGCIETIITVMYSHIFNRALQVDSLTAFMAIFAAGVAQSTAPSSTSSTASATPGVSADDMERHRSWLKAKSQMCGEAVLTSCQGAVMKMEAVMREDRSRRRASGEFGITSDNIDHEHNQADVLTNPYQYAVDVQSRACQVLHLLASFHTDNRVLLADRLGCIPIVMEAIASLCNVPQVLHPAASIITLLCDRTEHRRIVAEKKGIDVLLLSLRRLTSYRLRGTANGSATPMSTNSNPSNGSAASLPSSISSSNLANGGVTRSTARAEEGLLAALTAALIDCGDTADAFARGGGVDACMDLLRLSPTINVQRHICSVLRAACASRTSVGEAFVNKRGLPMMITLINTNRASPLLDEAIGVLAAVCNKNARHRRLLVAAGGITCVVNTMKENSKAITILQACLALLASFANRTHGAMLLDDAGAVLFASIRACASSSAPSIIVDACHMIANLSISNMVPSSLTGTTGETKSSGSQTAATERQRVWSPQVTELAEALSSTVPSNPQVSAAIVQMRSSWK